MKQARIMLLAGCVSLWTVGGSYAGTFSEQSRPDVIVVVHGVGKKRKGWTDSLRLGERWNCSGPLVEINYNEDAGDLESLLNFAPGTRDWADRVRTGLQDAAREYPNSDITIVSHSWGSVVSKLVLSGGSAWTARYVPITKAELATCRISNLVTMGSPLCRPTVLRLLGTTVIEGKPAIIQGRWVNLFNKGDRVTRFGIPVGNTSIPEDSCENVELEPRVGHTGYWRSDQVAEVIRRVISP